MNASFGIDHPLIAVHDIALLRERLIALGFNMTAIGRHPWGTSTSLAMFEGCLIEVMGIYDDSLLDEMPAGDFRFGRHVHEHLQRREGVALTALHSTDALADAERARAAGFTVSGHLEFGRDVTLPDGRSGRTRTTLVLMPDTRWPRLSLFLCQQHRPELIYVPQWLEHPNTVVGIGGITVLAGEADRPALRAKFEGLYGPAESIDGGFEIGTANGALRVQTRAAIERGFAPLPETVVADREPGIVAIDLRYRDAETLRSWIANSGLGHREERGMVTLTQPAMTGNIVFRFRKSQENERS